MTSSTKTKRKKCDVDGCPDGEWLRGYCERHYFRIRRHGVPGQAHRRYSVAEAIESLISDPVVTDGHPEWTVSDLAQRVRCNHSVAKEAVTALFATHRLTRRKIYGGYHNVGTYTYRWVG